MGTSSLSLSAESETEANGGQPTLDKVTITINNRTLDTEVALTPRQRFNGLSYRKTLGADSGMLFVYQQEKELLFTMKDASIPLSIAFISSDLVILEITDMEPFNVGPYASSGPAKYALEVNQGWFAANHIQVGDKLSFNNP